MRLFIGVAPDQLARASLAESAQILAKSIPGRYSDPTCYHVTLAFLGERSSAEIPQIHQAMLQSAKAFTPFTLELGPIGCFGSTIWRGFRDCEEINKLASALRSTLSAFGIDYDTKPFRAHITLARNAMAPKESEKENFTHACYPVRTLTLFESTCRGKMLLYLPKVEVHLR